MGVEFIYSEWLKARRTLFELLNLSPGQQFILSSFFENCIFEVGAEYRTRNLSTMDTDFKNHAEEVLLHRIAEQIHANGAYIKNHIKLPTGENIYEVRILLCGINKLPNIRKNNK